jgi:hypothetical protein
VARREAVDAQHARPAPREVVERGAADAAHPEHDRFVGQESASSIRRDRLPTLPPLAARPEACHATVVDALPEAASPPARLAQATGAHCRRALPVLMPVLMPVLAIGARDGRS